MSPVSHTVFPHLCDFHTHTRITQTPDTRRLTDSRAMIIVEAGGGSIPHTCVISTHTHTRITQTPDTRRLTDSRAMIIVEAGGGSMKSNPSRSLMPIAFIVSTWRDGTGRDGRSHKCGTTGITGRCVHIHPPTPEGWTEGNIIHIYIYYPHTRPHHTHRHVTQYDLVTYTRLTAVHAS